MEEDGFQIRTVFKYIIVSFLVILAVFLKCAGMFWLHIIWVEVAVWFQFYSLKDGLAYDGLPNEGLSNDSILDCFPEETYLTTWHCKKLFQCIFGDNVKRLPRQVVIGIYVRVIALLVHSGYMVVIIWSFLKGILSEDAFSTNLVWYLGRDMLISIVLFLLGVKTTFLCKFKQLNKYNVKYLYKRVFFMHWREEEPGAVRIGRCRVLVCTSKRRKRYATVQMEMDNKIYEVVLPEKKASFFAGDAAEVYEICEVKYLG